MDYELLTNGNVKIGQKAPNFEANSTFGNIALNDYKGKWLVLFSHPRRFYSSVHDRNDCFYKSSYIL